MYVFAQNLLTVFSKSEAYFIGTSNLGLLNKLAFFSLPVYVSFSSLAKIR